MALLKTYEPPQLEELPFLSYGKHSPRSVVQSGLADAALPARELIEQFGSPLYVTSEQRLRENYRNFLNAFSRPGFETRIAYSIKTNYLPALCSILREEGAWAEVVSGMEYDLARALGFAAHQIIFNGPHKTRDDLERALVDGAIVNLDHFAELDCVELIVDGFAKPAKVGMRISFEYGVSGWTKFGFNDDNGDSQKALERIAANPMLDLTVLHNHCGTFVLDRKLYSESVGRLIELARRARSLGLTPSAIDVGGGFPSENVLRPEYDHLGGTVRSGDFWTPYADVICDKLDEVRDLFDGSLQLILEPGRAIIDAAIQMLATVVASKPDSDDTTSVIIDAGINLVPTAVYYDHPLMRHTQPTDIIGTSQEVTRIYGPLCMQSDQLRREAITPNLKPGDIIVISHVGAYCHTQSAQFIQTRPATVLIGPNGPELIRRREEWRDVFRLDNVPERLRGDDFNF